LYIYSRAVKTRTTCLILSRSAEQEAINMVKGSCVCGDWTFEYEGEPAAVAVCHCIPCRKTAGTNGSVNSIIPSDKVIWSLRMTQEIFN
jgi:hypothetical protein